GDRGPQALVVHLGLAREVHEPPRAHGLRAHARALAHHARSSLHHLGEDAPRALPRLCLRGRDDRAQRHADPKAAAFSWISAMRRLTAASGSPQSAYTSQCLAATVAAAPEAPPK